MSTGRPRTPIGTHGSTPDVKAVVWWPRPASATSTAASAKSEPPGQPRLPRAPD
jgi:hypothetical protein